MDEDTKAYAYLLNVLPPNYCNPLTLDTEDATEGATHVLDHAERLGCKRYLSPKDIVEGLTILNLAFAAQIFHERQSGNTMDAPTFSLISRSQESEATTDVLGKDTTSRRTRKINCRCYPGKLIPVFQQMREGKEEEKISLMKNVGFYDLIKMQLTGLHTDFLLFVRDNFIPENLNIDLGRGDFLSLTEEDVQRVYNLPKGLNRISLSSARKEDIETLKRTLNINPKSNEVPVKEIYDKLSTYTNVDTWFKAIMLCIIGYVLCPKSQLKVSLRYATILNNPKAISELNWCRHVLDICQQSIKPSLVSPSADFHFITVHVMDTLYGRRRKDDAPTCRKWTNEDVHNKFTKISAYFPFAIGKKLLAHTEESLNTENDSPAGEGEQRKKYCNSKN